uniref:G_PROTEIN_RECEP_F1_2 domain-containing protein n=1 Tax=Caenorhabditis tropicalis TaxID=1561998 RepID=A0A1I7UIR1_9PELO
MNRLVEYGSVESIPYYNCSRKTFSEWEQTGIKRPWLGYPLIVFGVFIELLYIPIIYIIFKTRLIRHSCYKIIVVLAFIDMGATCCSCLITGPLLVMGSVFCMYPTFTYVAGGIALVI